MVRRIAEVGQDLIIGMSTAGDGRNKVIYVMQVDEKLPYNRYFKDLSFQKKKPNLSFKGDNFFREEKGALTVVFEQAAHFGKKDKIKRDLNAPVAVIGHKFWYFGENAPELPVEFHNTLIAVPDRSRRGHRTIKDQDLITFFTTWLSQYRPGIHGRPRDLAGQPLIKR